MKITVRTRLFITLSVFVVFFAGGLSVAAAAGPPQIKPAEGSVAGFRIEPSPIELHRAAQPQTPFDKVGRKFALLGYESGAFEAWAYPLKLLRGFEFSFLLGTSTVPIEGRDIVRFISVQPAVTTLTYTYQSFTMKAHFVAPVEEPGAVILLDVDSSEPLTIVCSFIPVLQPMWPAGLGGQYAYWDDGLKAYLISEPTRKNHGYLGSPAARGISYTPAHMLSDVPNQFKIEIDDPRSVVGRFIPVVVAGGKGARDDVKKVYQDMAADPEKRYRRAVEYFAALRQTTLGIRTPARRLDLAFEWAKVALDGLIVDNPDLGRGLDYTTGAQAFEIEVDLDSGKIEIIHAVSAFDVGRAINPDLVRAQMEGGMVQGISSTIFEQMIFKDGQMQNPNFVDYRIATTMDLPKKIESIIVEEPQDDGPWGARGVGEHPMVPTIAAIANAINDAVGIRMEGPPFTAEKVYTHLKLKRTQEP